MDGLEDRQAEDVLHDVQVEQPGDQGAGQQLDQEIADREPRPAGAAAAAQQPVAEERHVVVPADRLEAMAAARARPEDALFEGHAVDADVEEAADDGAEQDQAQEPEVER